MTVTEDRPAAPGDRQRPAPQGGPAADHRPHPLDRQHPAARACCTSRWCAARSPTRRSPAIDTERGQGRAQRRRRAHRRRPRRRRRASCINAWPITPDQVTPDHLPMAVDRVAFAGEIVAVVVARTRRRGPRRRRARRRRLRRAAGRARPQGGRRGRGARAPRPRHQQVARSGASTPREAGTGGNVDEAIAKARADGIVIEREYRQQRLIPAFMEPRSVVVDPTGEQITMWSATQIPHILRFALAATTGVPESKIRVIAPDVGGGFGGKLQATPEEWIACAVGPPARQAGEVHRDPLASR